MRCGWRGCDAGSAAKKKKADWMEVELDQGAIDTCASLHLRSQGIVSQPRRRLAGGLGWAHEKMENDSIVDCLVNRAFDELAAAKSQGARSDLKMMHVLTQRHTD